MSGISGNWFSRPSVSTFRKTPVQPSNDNKIQSNVNREAQVKKIQADFFTNLMMSNAFLAGGLGGLAFFSALYGCDSDEGTSNNTAWPDAGADSQVEPNPDGGVSGDAGVDSDVDGGSVGCIPNENRQGIVDSKRPLVYDTYDCVPLDIDSYGSNMYIACAHPNNRLLTYQPTSNGLQGLGQVPMTSQGPDGHVGDVHPKSIYPFDNYLSVPFQTKNSQFPTDVFGGVYLYDITNGAHLDTTQMSFQITCGGCPQENIYQLYGPVSALSSGDRLYVTNENFNPETGDYVRSFVPGFELKTDGMFTQFDYSSQPALAMPGGYRTAGTVKMDENSMAVVVSGLASKNEPAKIVFFNTSTNETLPVPILREIDLNLDGGEQLVSLAEPAVIAPPYSNPTQIATVASDGATYKLVVTNLDENATEKVHKLDITSWVKGEIKGIVSNGYRVYVMEKGGATSNNVGSLIAIDIDENTGQPTLHSVNGNPTIPLGVNPSAAEVDKATGKIYVAVERRSDCNAIESGDSDPYLVEVDPDIYFANQN